MVRIVAIVLGLGLAGCPAEGTLRTIDAAASVGDAAPGFFDAACSQEVGETNDAQCSSAIYLGALDDSNTATIEVTGNIVPADDVDFYSFLASDSLDFACDSFHVRVWFLDNPGDAYVFDAWRGGCAGEFLCDGVTDLQWYTNYSAGGLGECPCSPSDVNHCGDDSSEFHVRVRRKDGLPLSCTDYTLEISNGKYTAP